MTGDLSDKAPPLLAQRRIAALEAQLRDKTAECERLREELSSEPKRIYELAGALRAADDRLCAIYELASEPAYPEGRRSRKAELARYDATHQPSQGGGE